MGPWLVGRREEVETVLGLVIGDWTAGRIGFVRAVGRSGAYLDDLHDGARRCLGSRRAPECCADDEALTVCLAEVDDAVARLIGERVLPGQLAETCLDPPSALDVAEAPFLGSGPRAAPVGGSRFRPGNRKELAPELERPTGGPAEEENR